MLLKMETNAKGGWGDEKNDLRGGKNWSPFEHLKRMSNSRTLMNPLCVKIRFKISVHLLLFSPSSYIVSLINIDNSDRQPGSQVGKSRDSIITPRDQT